MMSFDLEESHAVLGALEKRYVRTYLFRNLPGGPESEKTSPSDGPQLIVYDKDRVVREHAGEELVRVRRIGDRVFKLTFMDDKGATGHGNATAMRLMMGKRNVTVRTVKFRGTSTMPHDFMQACRKLNPAVEVDYKDGDGDAGTVSGGSDVESKTSLDNMSAFMRDSDGGRGRSPQGSFDSSMAENPTFSSVEPTLVEHLGSGLLSMESSGGLAGSQGRFDVGGGDDEELMGGLRLPPNSAASLSLSQAQSNAEFSKEISTWPKYFCRVRNRYGTLEGKMLALGTDELRFLSLVENVVGQEVTGGGEIFHKDTKDIQDSGKADEEEDLASMLAQQMPSSAATSETASSVTGSGQAPVKQEFAYFWSLSKSRISKLVLYGVYGTHIILRLDDGIDIDLAFETPGTRSHFSMTVFGNATDSRIVQLFPGGEECAVADLQGAASEFGLVALKGMGSVRASRFFILNRADRCIWIFRNADLMGNVVSESCVPFRAIVIPNTGLTVEQVRSSRIRLKWGFHHSQTVASAPSSSSIVPSVKGDGSEKNHFDLLFPNYFERERFMAHLFSLASPLRVIAPPPQLRFKYQRIAWHRPQLSWFEVKRSLFLGTFNVSDAAPPDPATLDLWVAHPIKMKRDMITGGLKSTTRTRAKSGSAGVTGRFSLYVFGLQECGNKFDDWSKALHNHLGSEYGLVSSARLWEIGILVFALLSEVDKISAVETGTVATGRGIAKEVTGVQLGNKGGVAIGLRWRDTALCFVNAHLAPHQEKIAIRNQNFQQIMNKLGLNGSAGDCGEIGFEPTHAFEHVFFFGDLNYRVDETFQKVISIASQGKWPQLHAMDQLKREMDSGRCYFGFREAGIPHFPPTYRWEKNKRAFSNKRDQPPSYTDRVLIWSRPGIEDKVVPHLYGSSQDIMISDHRPVAATFTLTIREPYTPWPLHPLTAEMPKKDAADETSVMNEGSKQPAAGASSSSFQQQHVGGGWYEREASSGGTSVGSSSSMPQDNSLLDGGFTRPLSKAITTPLYQLTSSSAFNGSSVVSVQDREEELRDQDEEDDPEQFIGPLGSFFITPESFTNMLGGAPPEMRLSNLQLKLEKREERPAPPAFVQMRVASRVLQEVETLDAVPGMEDISKNEYAFNYETGRTWNDLYYQWHQPNEDPSSSSSETHQQQQYTVLKPTIWDPCYLSTQQLLIAVEEISSTKKKEEAKKKVSVLDDEEGHGESPTNPSGRKTLTSVSTSSGIFAGSGGGDAANNRLSARLSRRKRSVGTAAMHIGSAIVGAAAGGSAAAVLTGQASLSLKPIVEEIRRLIAKEASLTGWSRLQPFSLEFSEPVVYSGVCIGTLKGTLSLVPSGLEERKAFESKKATMHGRVSGRHLEPLFGLRSFDVEVQLDGFSDKKGSAWRRVFAALDSFGTLYLCPKAPGGNKSGQTLTDALGKTALIVLDVGEGSLDYAVGSANSADRAFTFELTARKVSSCAYDTMQSRPAAIVVFSLKDEADRRLWGTCIQSFQLVRRHEDKFAKEVQRSSEGRKEQRAKRLEIERKRRRDQEEAELAFKAQAAAQAAAAQSASQSNLASPSSKVVSFDESPPQIAETSSSKASFLSRALLMSKRSGTNKGGNFDELTSSRESGGGSSNGNSGNTAAEKTTLQAKPSFRERWFGGGGGGSFKGDPADLVGGNEGDHHIDDSQRRSPSQSTGLATRSAAHSSYGGAGSIDVLSDAMIDALSLDHPDVSSPSIPKPAVVEAPRGEDSGQEEDNPAGMSIAQRLRERAKHSKLKVKRNTADAD